jgi:hypothetical protein
MAVKPRNGDCGWVRALTPSEDVIRLTRSPKRTLFGASYSPAAHRHAAGPFLKAMTCCGEVNFEV